MAQTRPDGGNDQDGSGKALIRDDVSTLKLLGAGSMPEPGAPASQFLEAFPNRFPGRLYMVSIVFPEFTSLCPVTGQPDFATIALEYVPDARCVESKSFKLYMFAHRQARIFMETVTNAILDDLVALLDPHWCRVKGLFVPRGGTRIHVYAEQYRQSAREREVREFVKNWLLQPAPDHLS